jgi:hypothetical protein
LFLDAFLCTKKTLDRTLGQKKLQYFRCPAVKNKIGILLRKKTVRLALRPGEDQRLKEQRVFEFGIGLVRKRCITLPFSRTVQMYL